MYLYKKGMEVSQKKPGSKCPENIPPSPFSLLPRAITLPSLTPSHYYLPTSSLQPKVKVSRKTLNKNVEIITSLGFEGFSVQGSV